jgi:hypothetical protein
VKLVVSLAVAALALGALAGCTSSPATSAAAPTPAQKCKPSTATIQWSLSDALTDPKQATYTPVRVFVLDYSEGNGVAKVSRADIGPSPSVAFDDENALAVSSDASTAQWKTALFRSVRLTGQVSTDFGTRRSLPEGGTTVDTRHGKFLDVDQEILTSVPFSIKCAGEKQITGSVVATAPGTYLGVLIQCGDKAGKHDSATTKQAYALAPRFCTTAGQ